MYKITCCRAGKWPKANRCKKGCFVREFDSLYDFANFTNKSYPNLFYPYIRKELTKEERRWLKKRTMNYSRLKYKEMYPSG